MFEGFQGTNTVNLDVKGRIAIPSLYRERLRSICDNSLVLTINPYDPCLWLYPGNVWETIGAKLQQLPDDDFETRRTKRMMLGHATPSVLDGQGRIRVPESMRGYAGFEKAISVLGQGHRFEIWNADAWVAQREEWLQRVRSGVGGVSETLKGLAF